MEKFGSGINIPRLQHCCNTGIFVNCFSRSMHTGYFLSLLILGFGSVKCWRHCCSPLARRKNVFSSCLTWIAGLWRTCSAWSTERWVLMRGACVNTLPDLDSRPMENLLNMIHGKVSSEEEGTVFTPFLTWLAGLWRTCSTWSSERWVLKRGGLC